VCNFKSQGKTGSAREERGGEACVRGGEAYWERGETDMERNPQQPFNYSNKWPLE